MPSYINHDGKNQKLYDKYVPKMVPKNKKAVAKTAHEELLRNATSVYVVASLNSNYTWSNLVTYGVISGTYKAPKDVAKTVQTFFNERPSLTPKRLERMLDLVLEYVDAQESKKQTGGAWKEHFELLTIPLNNVSTPNPTFEDRLAHQSITDNEKRLTRSYPVNLTAGEIVLYRLPRASPLTSTYKKQYLSQYNPVLLQSLAKASFLCKSGVGDAFIDESVAHNEFLMVAYGIVNGSKMPIGFATMRTMYNRKLELSYPVLSSNKFPSRRDELGVVNDVLYLDLICAPFSTGGIGSHMIKALERADVRKAIEIEIGAPYESIALRGIDDVYTYYPMVHGYVRSNGNGKIYPFGRLLEPTRLFYDKKDVAAVEYPTDTNNSFLISNKKKLSEAFSQGKIKLFVGDAFEHGYLYMKRI
jgi:hypothetical protein